MSKSSEISKFENRFSNNIMEVAAVTGASGVGAGRGGKEIMWNASIDLIAWKELCPNRPVQKEELRLEWLADDQEWKAARNILAKNSVVRLQVRRGEKSFMLVQVLETEYKDDDLKIILQDSLKPVFYDDDVLGKFELDKSVKLFEKKISWAGEEGSLYFDWDEDKNIMKSALETAYALFKEQDEWNIKIRKYASEELIELANEWLQDNDEAEIDKITEEMFKSLMKLESISVYPGGAFEVFFSDGDMFWGHCIIVSGNINGSFTSADIAG